jgi:hypothetical protein
MDDPDRLGRLSEDVPMLSRAAEREHPTIEVLLMCEHVFVSGDDG